MLGHDTGKAGEAHDPFMGNNEERRESQYEITDAFGSVGVLGIHATREAKSLDKAAKRHNIL